MSKKKVMAWVAVLAAFVAGCPAGPPGPQGEPGKDGTDGDDGDPGADGLGIVEWVSCSKVDGNWRFNLRAVVYADGAAETTCSIADGDFESSSTWFWRAEQDGAASLGCLLLRDADGDGSGGFWSFERSAGGTISAEYQDASSPADGSIVGFDSDADCNLWAE